MLALWLRLSIVLNEMLPLDRKVQLHAWDVIISGIKTNCFRFYELNEPRSRLILYDRFEHMHPTSGLIDEPVSAPDLTLHFLKTRGKWKR